MAMEEGSRLTCWSWIYFIRQRLNEGSMRPAICARFDGSFLPEGALTRVTIGQSRPDPIFRASRYGVPNGATCVADLCSREAVSRSGARAVSSHPSTDDLRGNSDQPASTGRQESCCDERLNPHVADRLRHARLEYGLTHCSPLRPCPGTDVRRQWIVSSVVV